MIRPRTLFWVWTAGCCCWIGYWVWHYGTACRFVTLHNGQALACNWRIGDSVIGETAPMMAMLREILLHMQMPLCALIVGLVVYWVVLRSQARTIG